MGFGFWVLGSGFWVLGLGFGAQGVQASAWVGLAPDSAGQEFKGLGWFRVQSSRLRV
jgi:hypothetical protein